MTSTARRTGNRVAARRRLTTGRIGNFAGKAATGSILLLLMPASGSGEQAGTATAANAIETASAERAPSDYEMLRRLLGVPVTVAPAAPQPAAVPVPPAASAPVPGKSDETRRPARPRPTVTRSKPKPVAPARAASPDVHPASLTPEPSNRDVPIRPAAEPADRPSPGTVLRADSIERWSSLLPPSLQWVLRHGAELKVMAARPIPFEDTRDAATQRYSSQVELSADKQEMRNYVAGIPFPLVDAKDPDAAIKLMFNHASRRIVDDVDLRNLGCRTGSLETTRGVSVEREYLGEHYRRLSYVGRLQVPPMPSWDSGQGISFRESLHALTEPFDLKGAGYTYNRYVDPDRQDDSWLYYPQSRRVRRLSTAQRSEGVFGQDLDLDSYSGYAGNPAWTEWRLLGEKTVLTAMHAQHFPARWQAAPADFLFDESWEARDVYVLEGRSRLPGYAFSRRVIYLDRESFLIPYTELYDLRGNLWKSVILSWSADGPPAAVNLGSGAAPKHAFNPALAVLDMQTDHVTLCDLPSGKGGGEAGWAFNQGAAGGMTEEAFDVASFIQAGR